MKEGEREEGGRGEAMPRSQREGVQMMAVIGKEAVRTISHQSTECHMYS